MRRKDRAMPRLYGEYIIDRAPYGVLAMQEADGRPYAVPLSLARDGERLYYHCAREGHKIDLAPGQKEVIVTFVAQAEVPHCLEGGALMAASQEADFVRVLGQKVFTTEFESAIVRGRLREVTDEEERRHALAVICRRYTPDKMAYVPTAIDGSAHRTAVYAIEISDLTAKRKHVPRTSEGC